ncbi:hypothetical protein IU485_27690 [Nocardia cyriacigeorgica]|uniref:hypothetical protein n=1 Tax=Nocardia cyriacigeorgica TaxID=135487 RepID=UPI001895165E|nr:hypothetical protein [Nocardia cyriacigeorgica]MBF6085160.1 hypothetical protein [Nocardia cyriacigeorgica]
MKWQYDEVIAWIAQSSASSSSGVWWDIPLQLVPSMAIIVAAWIAGRYALRDSQRTPYDRLDQLLKFRQGWPEALEGLDTVDRSIAHALAEIRYIEGEQVHPTQSAEERAADIWAAQTRRRKARLGILQGLILSLGVAVLFVLPTLLSGNWRNAVDWPNSIGTWVFIGAVATSIFSLLTAELWRDAFGSTETRRQPDNEEE